MVGWLNSVALNGFVKAAANKKSYLEGRGPVLSAGLEKPGPCAAESPAQPASL